MNKKSTSIYTRIIHKDLIQAIQEISTSFQTSFNCNQSSRFLVQSPSTKKFEI